MKNYNIVTEILNVKGIIIQCPNCEETFTPNRAKLFDVKNPLPKNVLEILDSLQEDFQNRSNEVKDRRKKLKSDLVKKPEKVKITTESVNFGKIIEKIIPSFINFPYNAKECRTLFEPIDYIVFSGLYEKNKIEEIKFVDVKTGKAKLNDSQKNIQEAVNAGKVKVTIL